MSSKKILWLAHEANLSGANHCLKEFIELSSSEYIEQLLVIPRPGKMQEVAKELAIPVVVVPFYSWVRPLHGRFFDSAFLRRLLRNIIAVMQLITLILKHNVSSVFTNTSVINIGAWAALLTGRRHYWYIHEMGEEDFSFQLPWGRLSYRFMELCSSNILVNSRHLANKYAKKLERVYPDVVYNPVLVKGTYVPTAWTQTHPIRLLLMGQVTETKGHLHAIEAMTLLSQKGYGIELNIVGHSDENSAYKEQIIDLIKQNNLQQIVRFQEFSETPFQTIAQHHILLMCSRCEAFGRVTIEAMKIGVPVVGANTCGTKEILQHRFTGLLYEQGQSQSLAETIDMLIQEPELRLQIVTQAKKSANLLTNSNKLIQILHQ